MKTRSLISMVLMTVASFASNAESFDTHRVGAQLQGGSASYKSSSQDGDGVGSLYLYYNYQFDPTWALEVGINGGEEVDDWDCKDINKNKFVCDRNDALLFNLNANKVEYSNFVVAAKGYYPVTENSHFYGKLGGQFYEYEISRHSNVLVDKDGIGLFAEAGWQYDWDNGMAFNAGFQYMDMGDLDVTALAVGLSYRF